MIHIYVPTYIHTYIYGRCGGRKEIYYLLQWPYVHKAQL